MAKNDAEKAEFIGTDDEDLRSAVADALNAWFAVELTHQTELAAETKANYDEQKLQFDNQVERELEYAGIQFEWAKIREMEQDINNDYFLLDILNIQIDKMYEVEASQEDIDNEVKRRTKIQTEMNKLNENLTVARNVVQKKENAYWRKVETEDMRKHLNDVKRSLRETETHLVEQQAEVTRLTQIVETTSDATLRR